MVLKEPDVICILLRVFILHSKKPAATYWFLSCADRFLYITISPIWQLDMAKNEVVISKRRTFIV
jgi:hypothetical protein